MSYGPATAGGAVLSAFGVAASWVCCLPLVLGGLGAGSAVLATALAPLRPYLLGASLLLLGGAFYQMYRPRPAAERSGSGTEGCDGKRRRGFLWMAAVLVLILATVPYWLNWAIYWSL